MMRTDVIKWAEQTYGSKPESLWEKYPDDVVLRHENNKKWYAVIMTVKRSALGLDGEGIIDIINVKCDPLEIDLLSQQAGFFHGYHMNKNHWLTILLDDSVELETVCGLIQQSFEMTNMKIKKLISRRSINENN